MNEGPQYLYPTPDSREEGRRVDDRDGAQRLGVVGRREPGGFGEVAAQGPHRADRDVLQVDDGRDAGDGRLCRVRQKAAQRHNEPGHGFIESDAVARGRLGLSGVQIESTYIRW